MKLVVLIALGLLLSGQTAAQKTGLDPRLAVTVTTTSGTVVVVRGPEVNVLTDPELDYSWERPTVLPNRGGGFTAVYYLGQRAPYWTSQVYLVDPGGHVRRLEDDDVREIMWTTDGRYLFGTGENLRTGQSVVRLWNLSGGVREAGFQDIRVVTYVAGTICLNLNWYSPTTGQRSRSTEVHLAVPSLNQLSEKDTDGEQTCGRGP